MANGEVSNPDVGNEVTSIIGAIPGFNQEFPGESTISIIKTFSNGVSCIKGNVSDHEPASDSSSSGINTLDGVFLCASIAVNHGKERNNSFVCECLWSVFISSYCGYCVSIMTDES